MSDVLRRTRSAPGWAARGQRSLASVMSAALMGALLLLAAATPPGDRALPAAQSAGTAFVSDDFAAGTLSSRWTVADPVGDGSVSFAGAGTGDVRLALAVPAGTSHDPWGTNRALRVTQAAADVDLAVSTRFTSVPTARYQMQGILVEQDAANWLRFDIHSTGTSTRVFAGRTVNGSSSALLTQTITPGPEAGLRVRRAGSAWTVQYTTDGATWITAGTVTHALAVSRIGPFAGNSGANPAFTAEVDWFFDDSAPIEPEDGQVGAAYPLSTSVVGGGAVSRSPSAAAYAAGTLVTLTAQPAAGWEFVGWSGAASGAANPVSVVIEGPTAVTATFQEMPKSPPTIDVWYGTDQTFGANGKPQRWVNVLGKVADPEGVGSLTYSLNGGAQVPLKLGPNLRRLYGAGDFNVEIDYDLLASGANLLELTARDVLGHTATRTVTVRKAAPVAPVAPPYTVHWAGSSVNEVAQAVDGTWSTGPGGVTIRELGYDRTIALGDVGWTDYEVTVPVTVRGLGPGAGTPQSGDPLVGLGLRWLGHTRKASESPAVGWYPTGAFAWFRWTGDGRHELTGNQGWPVVRRSMAWSFGRTYVLKARAQTVAGGVQYSYKWWASGETEPAGWNLTLLEDSGPAAGAVLLIAHHTDATFGDVSVRPL